MSRSKLAAAVAFSVLVHQTGAANPIMPHYLSELQVSEANWCLELFPPWDIPVDSLDGGYLTTESDTAFFRDGIAAGPYLVVTDDSLQSPLSINPAGDRLSLHLLPPWAGQPELFDWIEYGDTGYCVLAAPRPGESISLNPEYQVNFRDFFYLDGSPTVGSPNDSMNGRGNVEGVVTDSWGSPIHGVRVSCAFGDTAVFTDADGYFILREFARVVYMRFAKESYDTLRTPEQVWPDSTVFIEVVLDQLWEVDAEGLATPGPSLVLLQNYPNPFEHHTVFRYGLRSGDRVAIDVFDVSGRLIDRLRPGFQNTGWHQIAWRPENLPAGTYVYTVRSHRLTLRETCLLTR
jgi:hypothetical protein